MASITFDRIKKVYPDGTEAIPSFSLEIADGEFMVLVGPSGCGKSTALRMVAGLEQISGGRLYVGEELVNGRSPEKRDIAMVFQDYALYPHMTVRDNIGFALRMMKVPKDEIRKRVDDVAERLSLTALLDRKPKNLSGGQRQRVAMGRAIVRKPKAFLMDEPLSNLDAKLRVQMRAEIAALQRQLGVTTLYVTHDQVEAMTMGDRVAVMKGGRLQQCAPPQELYESPANLFVAGFIGSPKMNLFKSVLRKGADGSVEVAFGADRWLRLSPEALAARPGLAAQPAGPIRLGLRPEGFSIVNDAGQVGAIDVRADVVEMLGPETLVHFVAPVESAAASDGRDQAKDVAEDEEESIMAGAGSTVMCARLVPPVKVPEGSTIRLAVDTDALYFFDAEGEALR
ncbi:MAG: sn-glycerol-3-phosphate ABC transporter ATP-binding protein UgpC [Chloroflexota bacterium]